MNKKNRDAFIIVFKKASKKRNAYIRSNLQEFKLTPNEIDVINFLYRNPTYNTASDMVEYLSVSKGLISRSVDSLVNKKFLDSTYDSSDKRKQRLTIRGEADELVKKIDKLDKIFFKQIQVGITKDEMKYYEQVMTKFQANIDNMFTTS